MGLKRITARIEVTYPADDPLTLAELAERTPGLLREALVEYAPEVGLPAFRVLNAAVDPDPEPELPTEPVPGDQTGRTAP